MYKFLRKKSIITTLSLLVLIGCTRSINNNNMDKIEPNADNKIDIGGYSLYTNISGKGSPTVIFEAGGGSSSDIWNLVQPEIAKRTQTFSYDRAGIGKSDESPLQRTTFDQVLELRTLLKKSNIEPPYIFVPNSYGAFISRLFAYKYPDEVAGIVFVDGTSEKLPEYIKEYLSFFKFQMYKFSSRSNPDGNYKELCHSKLQIEEAAETGSLRDTPIIILTSDIQYMAKEYADLFTVNNSPWMTWQRELANLSDKSKHYIIYGSGHLIHRENPKAVVKAITMLLNNTNWDTPSIESNNNVVYLPQEIGRYVGRYLVDVDKVISIEEEDGHFYAKSPHFSKSEIIPISEQRLQVKDADFTLELNLNKNSNNDSLIIYGKYAIDTVYAKRIDKEYHTPLENLMLGNIDEAITAYLDIYKTDPLNTTVLERRFNILGYNFLRNDKIDDAISIFKLNTELYPRSSNVYDSLAEAYMKAGDNDQARINYDKSLELNPNNNNAIKMLKQLQ